MQSTNTDLEGIKILRGEYVLRKKENAKSKVWDTFCQIIDEKGEVVPTMIACSSCKKVFKYNSRKLGTSSLLRHKCHNIKGRVNQVLNLPPRIKCELPKLSSENKSKILDGYVKFVCNDLRPLDIVAGCGFKNLVEMFVKVGATQKANFDLEDALPPTTVISSGIISKAQQAREELIQDLSSNLGITGGGITLELWQDGYSNMAYLSVTLHFAQNSMICSRILGSVSVQIHEENTGRHIVDEAFRILSNYGILDRMKNFIFVTEHGADINASMKIFHRINCAAHLLNNVLDDSISSDRSSLALVQSCIDIVNYCKSTCLQDRLSSVAVEGNTHWSSVFHTLYSVVENWDDIRDVLSEGNEADLIYGVERNDVKDLMEYIRPFQQALAELEGGNHPTIFLVHLWHLKLIAHLEPRPTDSSSLANLKSLGKAHYLEKVEIHPIHKVSVFLHPLLKGLRMLNMEERCDIYENVRVSVGNIKMEMENSPGSSK